MSHTKPLRTHYKKILLSIIFSISIAFATADNSTDTITHTWFTGPILAPAGVTIPKGHTNIEPYLFVTETDAPFSPPGSNQTVSSTSISPTLILAQGLFKDVDIQMILPYSFNQALNVNSNHLGDTTFILGLQMLHDKEHSWEPALRFTLDETLPTGRFENLNPEKFGIDVTGAGAYRTAITLNFQKLFLLTHHKFLRTRLVLSYGFNSSVQVQGLNVYGGNINSKGTVHPGNPYSADFSLEYTLTQHIVPAFDILYRHSASTRFVGNAGILPSGTLGALGGPASEDVSIAPAIEYNFNAHFGIIAGVWFSLYVKNRSNFTTGAIALNYFV